MEQKRVRYPVGIQTFSSIIEEGYQYADKTALVHELTHEYQYVFLSRPRRFGKSLLVSTLQSYFEGRHDLFKGLAIESLEREWVKHPVVKLSLASVKETSLEAISEQIDESLDDAERLLDITTTSRNHGGRLKQMIMESYRHYHQKVVVLIDEYDAPMLNNIGEEDKLSEVRKMMRALYAPLKDCDPYLRFVLITGITKFSQLSIFSELNNLANISMLPKYATICGITEQEMLSAFSPGIDAIAEQEQLTREETINKLREYYDGYHFAENSTAVYNPFSLVRAFAAQKMDYYWFGSGTPTFLINTLKKFNADITELDGCKAMAAQFDAPTESMTSVLPLFYQSGYLTIKGYDRNREQYTLRYPNEEVRYGLMNSLIPEYVTKSVNVNVPITAVDIRFYLLDGEVDNAMKLLQRFLKSIPYQEGTRRSEGHYTAMLYVIFMLIGVKTQTQIRTSDGRLDVLIEMPDRNYVMELKLDGSAAEAMAQIESKGYAMAVTNNNPTTKIGINFSTETGTVEEWLIK